MNRIIDKEGNFEPEHNPTQQSVIPIIEESINVEKRVVEADKVQISKKVNSEEVTVNVPTIHEEVQVERVAINKYVDHPPAVKHDGNTTIIPILKEVLVVEKKLMLVEEIHVTKRQVETSVAQKETLRKEEVIVERRDAPDQQ